MHSAGRCILFNFLVIGLFVESGKITMYRFAAGNLFVISRDHEACVNDAVTKE